MAKQKANFVTSDQSVEQAFEQILRTNLTTTRDWEPVVLAGEDPEGVHQMRVCLRRMRSALAVFRPAIPRKVTRSFFKEMRWAAKTLDRARDLDVYIAENLSSKGNKRKGKMRKLALKNRVKPAAAVTIVAKLSVASIKDYLNLDITVHNKLLTYWIVLERSNAKHHCINPPYTGFF